MKPVRSRPPRRWLPLLLLLSTTGTICRSAGNLDGNDAGADVIVWSSGNGTFVGTDSSGATVNATLTNVQVFLDVADAGTATVTSFLTAAKLGGDYGTGDLELTSPTGLIAATFDVNIGFDAAPLEETYTELTSGVLGGIGLAYSTASGTEAFSAAAAPASGSWTLALATVDAGAGGDGTPDSPLYEGVHGTLAATLTDGNGGSGALLLFF